MKKHKFSKWTHLYLLAVSVCLVFLIAGCTQGVTTSPTVEDEPIPTKTWTVMLYVCADNNLDDAGSGIGWYVMNYLEKAGSSDSINIIAQYDHTANNFGKKGAERYYITRNSEATVGEIQSPMVQELGNTNMGDPDTLVNFVEWGMKNYPANKYAVILWNHGGGWRGTARDSSVKGIIYDDTSNDHLTELEVKEAFQRIYNIGEKKLEFIGFDACLMGAIEVVDDLKDFGKYFVGSERSEWAPGWDYDSFLNNLRSDPSKDGKLLAADVVSTYSTFNIKNGKNDYTLAGVYLARTSDATTALDLFAKSAIENIDAEGGNLSTASDNTQSVCDTGEPYTDFKDIKLFMTSVTSTVSNTDLIAKANDVSTSIENLVLYKTQGAELAGTWGGLSIWLPSLSYYNSYISEYRKLTFAKNTDWDDFLDLLVIQ